MGVPWPSAAPRMAVSASEGTVRDTLDTPSTKRVRKMTFALLNMPSLSDTCGASGRQKETQLALCATHRMWAGQEVTKSKEGNMTQMCSLLAGWQA